MLDVVLYLNEEVRVVNEALFCLLAKRGKPLFKIVIVRAAVTLETPELLLNLLLNGLVFNQSCTCFVNQLLVLLRINLLFAGYNTPS